MPERRLTEMEKQQIAVQARADYLRANPGANITAIYVGSVTHPSGRPKITIEIDGKDGDDA